MFSGHSFAAMWALRLVWAQIVTVLDQCAAYATIACGGDYTGHLHRVIKTATELVSLRD